MSVPTTPITRLTVLSLGSPWVLQPAHTPSGYARNQTDKEPPGDTEAQTKNKQRMDVDSCIIKYQKMSGDIFKRPWQFPGKPIWDAYFKKPWFSEEKLKRSIESVVELMISPWEKTLLESRGVRFSDAPMADPGVPGVNTCNVFVCAVKVEDLTTTLLRTYPRPTTSLQETCPIWAAGRATTAAPLYFPPMKLVTPPSPLPTDFFDGGMKNNNPIAEVKDEMFLAHRVESPRCVLSIGTGYLTNATGDQGFWTRLAKWATGGFGYLGWTLLDLATNTQAKHLEILREAKYAQFRENYVRLNVPGKLANVEIERWDRMEEMRHLTEAYLATEEAKTEVRRCVEMLKDGRNFGT
ncbi:FabD/lysophospholipase-like protein [Tuber magnatum]|uniref:FabD/lysophospholipase-like protein n=1 Tax=Tuber magnatum TaxID=42249 RepID=A0A317SZF7_9PEZI|nr:FabD/lysophospholipase-like protein [Tuber magnatum]